MMPLGCTLCKVIQPQDKQRPETHVLEDTVLQQLPPLQQCARDLGVLLRCDVSGGAPHSISSLHSNQL